MVSITESEARPTIQGRAPRGARGTKPDGRNEAFGNPRKDHMLNGIVAEVEVLTILDLERDDGETEKAQLLTQLTSAREKFENNANQGVARALEGSVKDGVQLGSYLSSGRRSGNRSSRARFRSSKYT